MDMESPQLIQTLIESFNALAGEVQDLVDRKTILEHKLRFAHEQVCRYGFLLLSLLFFRFPGLNMMINSSRSAFCLYGNYGDSLYHFLIVLFGP